MSSYSQLLSCIDDVIAAAFERDSSVPEKIRKTQSLLEGMNFSEGQIEILKDYVRDTEVAYLKENDAVARAWYNPKHIQMREYSALAYTAASYLAGFLSGTALGMLILDANDMPPVLFGALLGIGTVAISGMIDVFYSYDNDSFALMLPPAIASGIYMHNIRNQYAMERKNIRQETEKMMIGAKSEKQSSAYRLSLPGSF